MPEKGHRGGLRARAADGDAVGEVVGRACERRLPTVHYMGKPRLRIGNWPVQAGLEYVHSEVASQATKR